MGRTLGQPWSQRPALTMVVGFWLILVWDSRHYWVLGVGQSAGPRAHLKTEGDWGKSRSHRMWSSQTTSGASGL